MSPPGTGAPAATVFISYSHKDEEWKDRLIAHLGVVDTDGVLRVWDDRHIGGGDDWLREIETAMGQARVAILLVTANFLTSPFIVQKEVQELLERAKRDGLHVLPVIVRPCAWQRVEWLASIQCRPRDGQPLSGGTEFGIDSALAAIAVEALDLARGVAPTVAIAPAAPDPAHPGASPPAATASGLEDDPSWRWNAPGKGAEPPRTTAPVEGPPGAAPSGSSRRWPLIVGGAAALLGAAVIGVVLAVSGRITTAAIGDGGARPEMTTPPSPTAVRGDRRAQPGDAARCPEGMRLIRGGEFKAFGSGTEARVKDFCLDVDEVTVERYTACVEAGSCAKITGAECNYGVAERSRHPVNCVDWQQAQDYCAKHGRTLPSEQQWEWAARGRDEAREYPWSSKELPTALVCWNGQGNDSGAGNRRGTCPADAYSKKGGDDSRDGIHGLAGNVQEWTASGLDESGRSRVIRGGSWSATEPSSLRVSQRAADAPTRRDSTTGFRCAREER